MSISGKQYIECNDILFVCFLELLRSKDEELRKILEEKSRLVAELRVKHCRMIFSYTVIPTLFPSINFCPFVT